MKTFNAKIIKKFMDNDEYFHFCQSYDQARTARQLITDDDEVLVQDFIDGHVPLKELQRMKKYRTKSGAAEFIRRTIEQLNKKKWR